MLSSSPPPCTSTILRLALCETFSHRALQKATCYVTVNVVVVPLPTARPTTTNFNGFILQRLYTASSESRVSPLQTEEGGGGDDNNIGRYKKGL